MADTSEDVTVRMKKNALSWFGHVERMSDERMAINIYDGKVSGKGGKGKPRFIFENTVSLVILLIFFITINFDIVIVQMIKT